MVTVGKAMSVEVNQTVMNELVGPLRVIVSELVVRTVTVLVIALTVFLSSAVLTIVVPLSVIDPLVTRRVPSGAPLVTYTRSGGPWGPGIVKLSLYVLVVPVGMTYWFGP